VNRRGTLGLPVAGVLSEMYGTIRLPARPTDGEKMQDRHSSYGTAEYWDKQAASFDDEPDHGLTTDRVRTAWSRRLAAWLPDKPSTVVDLGCGTGSLSVLAAEAGHETIGVDLSPAMVERAQLTARPLDLPVRIVVGDAAKPDLAPGTFDVALVRHVVWALPNPDEALRRWAALLKPDGRLIAIEGRWGFGRITATDLIAALAPLFGQVEHHPLSGDAELWGKRVDDERYVVIATGPRRNSK